MINYEVSKFSQQSCDNFFGDKFDVKLVQTCKGLVNEECRKCILM